MTVFTGVARPTRCRPYCALPQNGLRPDPDHFVDVNDMIGKVLLDADDVGQASRLSAQKSGLLKAVVTLLGDDYVIEHGGENLGGFD